MRPVPSPLDASIRHCVSKVAEIIESGRDDRRTILQLGYNLGRLSELTGLGREPFWDAWKGAVESWDIASLRALAVSLPERIGTLET